MSWFRRRDEIAEQQRAADAAIVAAGQQSQKVDAAASTLRGWLGKLAQLNEENNFAPKMLKSIRGDM